jgi:hypothetical protein
MMNGHPPIGKVGDECRGACGISVFDGSLNGRRKMSVLTVAENIKIFPSFFFKKSLFNSW